MRVIAVPKRGAEALRRELHAWGLVDPSVKITKRNGLVLIPVTGEPPIDLTRHGARLETDALLVPRQRPRDPKAALQAELRRAGIPASAAPRGWERIGDVLVIRIPPEGWKHAAEIAEVYGSVLQARTVVEDVSGIHGPLRTPDVRVLWGDGTETVHTEGGIRYALDIAQVMFSSGNLGERADVARRVRPGEVVVDLFAGIGYFAIPIAVRSRASIVYACELNPVSFRFLLENVRRNRADRVVPLLGDCRETAPRGVADRVLMGHFDARDYLEVAFACLRGSGTIVYHEVGPAEQVPEEPVRRFAEAARAHWMQVVRVEHRIVKSYAPGIVHVLLEARVRPITRRERRGIRPKGT